MAGFNASKGEDATQFVPNRAVLLVALIAPVARVVQRILVELAASLIDEQLSWSVSPLIIFSEFLIELPAIGGQAMTVLACR